MLMSPTEARRLRSRTRSLSRRRRRRRQNAPDSVGVSRCGCCRITATPPPLDWHGWGDRRRLVNVTWVQIALFGPNDKEIPLRPGDIAIENLQSIGIASAPYRLLYPPRSSDALTPGRPHWMAAFSSLRAPGCVTVQLPAPLEVGRLKVWNYGASSLESSKGVKEVRPEPAALR